MNLRPIATLAAVVVLLAACGEDPEPTTAPPATTAPTTASPPPEPSPTTPAVTTPPPFEAADVNDFGKLCGKPDHRASPSRPYGGAAPHAIVEFGKDVDNKTYDRDYAVDRKGEQWDPQNPEDVQLLACITGVKAGKRVGTCRYRTDSGIKRVTVDAQRFTIDVFALDTGKRIARKTFLADFCPPGIVTLNGGADIPKRMYSTMTSEDRVKALDAYVGK